MNIDDDLKTSAQQLGLRIKELRIKAKLTQDELGFDIGCGASTISNYENGTREPNITALYKMANQFNEIIGDYTYYLFTGEEIGSETSNLAVDSKYVRKDHAIEKFVEFIPRLIKERKMRFSQDFKLPEFIKLISKECFGGTDFNDNDKKE